MVTGEHWSVMRSNGVQGLRGRQGWLLGRRGGYWGAMECRALGLVTGVQGQLRAQGGRGQGRDGSWGAGVPGRCHFSGRSAGRGTPFLRNKAKAPTHGSPHPLYFLQGRARGEPPAPRHPPAPSELGGRAMTSLVSFLGSFYRNTVRLCTDYLHPSPSLAYKVAAGKPAPLPRRQDVIFGPGPGGAVEEEEEPASPRCSLRPPSKPWAVQGLIFLLRARACRVRAAARALASGRSSCIASAAAGDRGQPAARK